MALSLKAPGLPYKSGFVHSALGTTKLKQDFVGGSAKDKKCPTFSSEHHVIEALLYGVVPAPGGPIWDNWPVDVYVVRQGKNVSQCTFSTTLVSGTESKKRRNEQQDWHFGARWTI
jgi:hypothetical protein